MKGDRNRAIQSPVHSTASTTIAEMKVPGLPHDRQRYSELNNRGGRRLVQHPQEDYKARALNEPSN